MDVRYGASAIALRGPAIVGTCWVDRSFYVLAPEVRVADRLSAIVEHLS